MGKYFYPEPRETIFGDFFCIDTFENNHFTRILRHDDERENSISKHPVCARNPKGARRLGQIPFLFIFLSLCPFTFVPTCPFSLPYPFSCPFPFYLPFLFCISFPFLFHPFPFLFLPPFLYLCPFQFSGIYLDLLLSQQ